MGRDSRKSRYSKEGSEQSKFNTPDYFGVCTNGDATRSFWTFPWQYFQAPGIEKPASIPGLLCIKYGHNVQSGLP